MEQISSTYSHGQLKENDITLVLEQLQEDGFSSFFDHPDCPFSSIQEVEETLKELEKEFRKIAVEQRAKTAAKKNTRHSSKSFLSNHPKLKPNVEKNEFREEFNPKFRTCSVTNKNAIMGKNKINPKFIWPRTRSAFNKDNRIVDTAKCGDSKEVYGVDSRGNKYSLKRKVFARVELEPEDDMEASKNMIKKSEVLLSPSKQKGLKSNEKDASFKPLLKTIKEQTETCVPLLLNYRSPRIIPCLSYTYPTACDLKKNCSPQISKFDGIFRNNCAVTEKRDKKIDCENDHFKVISKTKSEPIDVLRNNIAVSLNLYNTCYQNVDIKPKLVPNDHSYLSDKKTMNLSSEENNQDFNDLYPGNQSLKIQTSLENYKRKDSIPYQVEVLKTQETSKMLIEGQQKYCYENIQQISSTKEDENNSKGIVSSADRSHNNMIDKGVETNLLLLFDQKLIKKLKRFEEIINISYNEGNEEACDGKCIKGGSTNHPLSRRFDKSINDLIQNIAYDAEPNNKHSTFSDPENEVKNISEKVYSRFNLGDVGVKADLLANCTAFNVKEQEKKYVEYLQTVSEVEASRNIIKLDDRNFYENELSDSSSIETVITNVCLDRELAKESIIRKKSVLDVDTSFDLQSKDMIDATSLRVYEEPLSSLSVAISLPFDSAENEVGTYLEQIDIGKPLDLTLNEYLNCNKLIENKISKFEEDVVSSVKNKKFLDIGVGLSEELFSTSKKLIMVDKEVRGTSIDSFDLKRKVIMVDKEIGPETTVERFKDYKSVDKKIGTIVESNSMSTSMHDVLMRGSLGEIMSKEATKLKNKINDVTFLKKNTDVVESKNNFKFAKWSKAKPSMRQMQFKIPDSKSYESDKIMRISKQRKETKKMEGLVKIDKFSTRNHSRKKEDKDIIYCSNKSSTTPAQLDRLDKGNYRINNKTKFVFTINCSAAKKMAPFRRPMYFNLDQKSTANELAKSRKMIGNFISSKSPNWDRFKPDYRGKLPRKQFAKELRSDLHVIKFPKTLYLT